MNDEAEFFDVCWAEANNSKLEEIIEIKTLEKRAVAKTYISNIGRLN